jgi:hypothetical protein
MDEFSMKVLAFHSWKSVHKIASMKFHPLHHWKPNNDILWMFIHEIRMTFNAKDKIVNKLHVVIEI